MCLAWKYQQRSGHPHSVKRAFEQIVLPHANGGIIRPRHDVSRGCDLVYLPDSLTHVQGTADPDHLTLGGYSYGGFITNWLITHTTRFRAAVTGAGAVEHTANWGNDEMTFDDAYILGGTPWQVENAYNSEASIRILRILLVGRGSSSQSM
jgi:Prolyl oligopeptidase family